jgi:hypothetical protein
MEIFSPVLENSAMDLCLVWSMNFSGVRFFMLLPRVVVCWIEGLKLLGCWSLLLLLLKLLC